LREWNGLRMARQMKWARSECGVDEQFPGRSRCTALPWHVSRLLGAIALGLCCAAGTSMAVAADMVELDCLIEPKRSVVVAASVIGVVDSIEVDRGDFVEAGQLLATLESSMEQAAVAMAKARAEGIAEIQSSKARLEFEKRRLERGNRLRQQNVLSIGELDELESGVIVAQANLLQSRENRVLYDLELQRAEAVLAMRSIRSPVDGVVVELILSGGEYADPPQVMKIAQIDPLRVEVYAPVSLLGRIEVGSVGKVALEGPSRRSYTAPVVVVDGVVDAASGTFGVRLELPNEDREVLAGLSCKVQF
jgi:RND family efflux transporter MFP subunit